MRTDGVYVTVIVVSVETEEEVEERIKVGTTQMWVVQLVFRRRQLSRIQCLEHTSYGVRTVASL